MGLQTLNDKTVPGDKSIKNCNFLFSPPALTIRASILFLMQSLPSKNAGKARGLFNFLCRVQIHRI
uniref:Uncharacterized protein n=1 Tax=Moschus moschiferus TaxID=68415 RepID=A0A8C6D8M4_MOSMO